jgi:hypothetical protein
MVRNVSGHYELVADLQAVRTLEVWLNVFIPNDVVTARQMINGEYAGKIVIEGPPGSGWFLTDSRGFSRRRVVSSRLQLLISIDLPTGKVEHDAIPGLTVELDDDGTVVNQARTSTDRVRVGPVKRSEEGRKLRIPFKAAVSDPLVLLARLVGDVDVDGTLEVEIAKTWDEVTVRLNGRVDAYPAFEGYARLTEKRKVGPTETLFTIAPRDPSLPYMLMGPTTRVSRRIKVEATLKPSP